MRGKLTLAAAILSAAALGTHLTGATFTAARSNPTNTFAAAASFCTGGTQTLAASKDTYIAQNQGNSNFGTATSTFAQSTTAALLGARRTLTQFTLPAIPQFCSLTAATLRLYATSATSGRTIGVQRANASWTESGAGGVTWNTRPATTGTIVTAASGSGAGFRTWAVTSLVQAMYSGTNNGFQVWDQSEVGVVGATQQYQSREGSNNAQDPQLVVTFG